jgi:FSR family fosmidomycin resistance protein-like MFS transporter
MVNRISSGLCLGILGMFVLTKIAVWYQNHLNLRASKTINEEETVPKKK